MVETEATPLAAVAARFSRDEADAGELTAAFEAAVLFCRREKWVGFSAVGDEGAGWIPMYSSPEELVRAEGVADWFAAEGADLLRLVPEGYGIVLDHGAEHEVWLAAWAIKQEQV